MLHRLDMQMARNNGHMMPYFWRSLDNTFKEFEKDMEHMMRYSLRRFEQSDGIQHVKSPYVTDEAGNKKLLLRYDVSRYKPEEISVKTVENKLVVDAKQTMEEAGEKWYSQFSREITLPKEVQAEELKSTLSTDGILQIEAPLKPELEAPKQTKIPIEIMEGNSGTKTEGS